jgi:hypothetical protein
MDGKAFTYALLASHLKTITSAKSHSVVAIDPHD